MIVFFLIAASLEQEARGNTTNRVKKLKNEFMKEIEPMKEDMDPMKEEIESMKEEIGSLKEEIGSMKEELSEFKKMIMEQLGKKNCTFTEDNEENDHALMKADSNDNLEDKYANVSSKDPELGEEEERDDEGGVYILEIDKKTSFYPITSDDSYGFSGAGYFDENGELIAIHLGHDVEM